jgi:hypothetical protein
MTNLGPKVRNLRLKDRRKIYRMAVVLFWIFSIIYFISASYILTRLESFRVEKIVIEGNLLAKEEDIQAIIDDVTGNDTYRIFSHHNYFIYPQSQIRNSILKNIIPIKDIVFEKIPPLTIKLKVEERQPFALFCKKGIKALSVDSSNCYFFDKEAIVYSKAPSFSNEPFIKFSGFVEGEITPGTVLFTKEKMQEYTFLFNSLENENIVIQEFIKNDDGDLVLSTKGGTQLIVSERVGLSKSLENLKVFLADEKSANLSEALSRLEYLDLRFGNKIYYRYRGD